MEIYRCVLRNEGGNQYDLPHYGIIIHQNQGGEVIYRVICKKCPFSWVRSFIKTGKRDSGWIWGNFGKFNVC